MIISYIFVSVLVVSLVSFVGAVLLSLERNLLNKSLSLLVSLAVGALLGDVFVHIIPEAYETMGDPTLVSTLLITGILLFFVLEKVLHWHHGHTEEHSVAHPHPIGRLVLISDGVHNAIDGLLIGASYLISIEIGIATTVAVILHEIPQEVGNFAVLLHAGYSKTKALWFNFLSALTAVAGAGFALLMGDAAEQFALWVLPVTAGGFIYIALSDLIPELNKDRRLGQGVLQIIAIIMGVAAMIALLALE